MCIGKYYFLFSRKIFSFFRILKKFARESTSTICWMPIKRLKNIMNLTRKITQ